MTNDHMRVNGEYYLQVFLTWQLIEHHDNVSTELNVSLQKQNKYLEFENNPLVWLIITSSFWNVPN